MKMALLLRRGAMTPEHTASIVGPVLLSHPAAKAVAPAEIVVNAEGFQCERCGQTTTVCTKVRVKIFANRVMKLSPCYPTPLLISTNIPVNGRRIPQWFPSLPAIRRVELILLPRYPPPPLRRISPHTAFLSLMLRVLRRKPYNRLKTGFAPSTKSLAHSLPVCCQPSP